MTAVVILTSPAGPALLAVAVALGLRFPAARSAPSVARRLVESFVDDRTWRDEMIYRAKFYRAVTR